VPNFPCAHPGLLRRCTSLQVTKVIIDEEQLMNGYRGQHPLEFVRMATVGLAGSGSSPAQRRLSLQQDLAAFTSNVALDHSAWQSLRCLTSIRLHAPFCIGQYAPYFTSAVSSAVINATSLVRLEVSELVRAEDFALLARLSNLRSLTHLTVGFEYWVPRCSAVLQDGLSSLSRLQKLTLTAPSNIHVSHTSHCAHPALALPSSQLACLTSVRLGRFSLGPSQPAAALEAVRELELLDCRMGSLAALSGCHKLTRLVRGSMAQRRWHEPHDAREGSIIPDSWREGLRSLEWHAVRHDDICWSWVEQLRGIIRLCLVGVDVTPDLFWCASLTFLPPCAHTLQCRLVSGHKLPMVCMQLRSTGMPPYTSCTQPRKHSHRLSDSQLYVPWGKQPSVNAQPRVDGHGRLVRGAAAVGHQESLQSLSRPMAWTCDHTSERVSLDLAVLARALASQPGAWSVSRPRGQLPGRMVS
jgi:hypothetical protein